MQLCLFEDDGVAHLLPLVHTRAVYDLRLGIRTILEATRAAFGGVPLRLHARPQVAAVTAQEHALPVNDLPEGDVLFVNGRYVAEEGPVLERLRRALVPGEPPRVFVQGGAVVAARVRQAPDLRAPLTRAAFAGLPEEVLDGARMLGRLWHLLDDLPATLERDFAACLLPYNIHERPGAVVHEGARLVGGERIYLAPGATVHPGAVLNATEGPIYVDREAVIRENAVVRGPAYVGARARVHVGADVSACALGPWSKVGGEVVASVLHGYTNKPHGGFLGHAYLGRWCNLGAGTNNSNLKNDYGPVRLYDEATGASEATGRQFLGLFMADHAKCGIGTVFNTGTVVGVACNLYGSGFHPTYVPSFSWGHPGRYVPYRLPKALRVAEVVMARRGLTMTDVDRDLLTAVYAATEPDRAAFMGK